MPLPALQAGRQLPASEKLNKQKNILFIQGFNIFSRIKTKERLQSYIIPFLLFNNKGLNPLHLYKLIAIQFSCPPNKHALLLFSLHHHHHYCLFLYSNNCFSNFQSDTDFCQVKTVPGLNYCIKLHLFVIL